MLHSAPTHPLRILIKHEDPLICVGLHAALATCTEFDVASSRTDRTDDTLSGTTDVLVTDHAQAMQVLQACASTRQESGRPVGQQRPMRILVVTSLCGEHQIRQAVMAGASGYVLLGGTLDEYVEAVRSLGQGMRYVCRRASRELMESVSQATLTTREREVLCPLVRGLANKAIARELGISVGTVKVHVRSILDKLQASSRTQAASVAVQRGLVDAGASHNTVARPMLRHDTVKAFDAGRVRPRPSPIASMVAQAA